MPETKDGILKKKLLKYGIPIHCDFNHQLAHRDVKEAL